MCVLIRAGIRNKHRVAVIIKGQGKLKAIIGAAVDFLNVLLFFDIVVNEQMLKLSLFIFGSLNFTSEVAELAVDVLFRNAFPAHFFRHAAKEFDLLFAFPH